MINSDLNVGGIHRAFIVTVGGDIRIYIPGLTSLIAGSNAPVNEDGTINKESYEDNKNSLPKPIWCLPNLEAKQHDEVHPCWVTFENGDSKRPIIMGFLGKGIKYHASSSGGSVSSSGGSSSGTYIGSGTTGIENADYVFKKLISAGASIGGAVAVLGMLYEEGRNFDPTNVNSIGATGICQWLGNRLNRLKNGGKLNGQDWNKPDNYLDLGTQVNYFIFEIKNNGHGNSSKVNWDDICKEYSSETEVTNLLFRLVRYYEIPFTATSESGLSGNIKLNYEEAKRKTIEWWNIFKNGKIENGQYSNNNSKINNYLIDNGAGGTRKEAKEHGSGSGTQCVELPNDYIQEVFGLKNYGGFGNGKDYYIGVTNQYPNVFEKIEWQTGTILKPGDIVSMSSPSQPQYGHVVIIKAINGNKIQILDQWAGCGNVQDSEWTLDGNVLIQRNGTRRTIYGIARPK